MRVIADATKNLLHLEYGQMRPATPGYETQECRGAFGGGLHVRACDS